MITLTLPIGELKDGTECHKPAGQKMYICKKELIIYGGPKKQELKINDYCYLVDEEGEIEAVHESRLVSVDFENLNEVATWIKESSND